jgi:hypothetical protein
VREDDWEADNESDLEQDNITDDSETSGKQEKVGQHGSMIVHLDLYVA